MKEYNIKHDEVYEYLRKSRSDDPLLTVEEVLHKHEIELNEYAEKHLGGRVPEENILREVASSETIDDRPEMVKLLKIIESPRIKAVLVVEVQRLSRGDLEDAGRIIKLFRYTNTLIITPRKTYNLQDEYDREAFERELKRGNEYLEYAKKVMNRGKLLAVKEGNYIATYPPYGYKKIHYRENKLKCSTLEIIESEAEIIRMIFDLYVNEDLGFTSIADRINALCVPTSKGDVWKRATIQEIISNVVYIGKVRWQYRKTTKSVEDQQVIKSRPRSKINECLMFEGKHKAIISEELFNKAQEKRSKNVPLRKNKNIVNPLAGIFYCAKCGKAMKLRPANKKNKARYECSEMKFCGSGSALYDDVIARVYEALEQCVDDFEIKLNENNEEQVLQHDRLIATLERRLGELDSKELKLWDKYTDEGMPRDIFEKLKENLLNDREELREALAHARSSAPDKIDYRERILTLKTTLDMLHDKEVDMGCKNRFLRQIISKMTYFREKPIRLTKQLAEEMGVPYPNRLCCYNYPFTLDITLHDDVN